MLNVCEIINDRFSWRLVVDGENIPFNTRGAAEYFDQHYSKLGYSMLYVKVTNAGTFHYKELKEV